MKKPEKFKFKAINEATILSIKRLKQKGINKETIARN